MACQWFLSLMLPPEDLRLFSVFPVGSTRENSRVIMGDFQAPSLTCDALTTLGLPQPARPPQ